MNEPWIKYGVLPGKRGTKFHLRRHYEHGKPCGYEMFIEKTAFNLLDWLINFSFFTLALFTTHENKVLRKARVHYGFMLYAFMLFNCIKHMKKLVDACEPLHIFGLSQGGAVGVILAALLREAYPNKPLFVTTYGSPPIGNAHFTRYCQAALAIKRMYYPIDLVVQAPYWLLGLRHVGLAQCKKPQHWWHSLQVIKNHWRITYFARDTLNVPMTFFDRD